MEPGPCDKGNGKSFPKFTSGRIVGLCFPPRRCRSIRPEKNTPAQARAALIGVHTAIEIQVAAVKTTAGRTAFWKSLIAYGERSATTELAPPVSIKATTARSKPDAKAKPKARAARA